MIWDRTASALNPSRVALLCGLGVALTGCGKGSDPVEPMPVDAGVSRLELGYFYERAYDPFEPGDDLPIFNALQGGTWTMPALRLRNFISPIRIVASVVTEAGETLGEIDQDHGINNEIEGWIEIKRLPIPATHEPPHEDDPITDLFGQNAILTIAVSDSAGRHVEASAEVVLADRQIL